MSDNDITHGKVITTTPQPDGSNEIETQSYYDSLAHRKVEREKFLASTQRTLLQDVAACLTHISEGSPELTIEIKRKAGDRVEIHKRWTVRKDNYRRSSNDR